MGTLQTIKEDYREKQIKNIAKWVIQYQDYQMKIALNKADTQLFSKGTLKNYFVRGLRYLRTEIKSSGVDENFYDFIDELVPKIQPLRPSFSERKKRHRCDYTKKENIPPVARLKMVQTQLLAKFDYGVRIENDIKLFKSEELAKAFLSGLQYAGRNDAKLVGVELQNIESEV